MAVFFAIFYINTSEELRILARPVFPYAIDLLSLSSPICLLITSPTVRKKYLHFYGLPSISISLIRQSASKVGPSKLLTLT
ncbi:hypothetical protein AAVH_10768 [Aphelenchoides avenae]|nr:hypothetical protein AAVH_10768 [Aphelenchus avenae]